MRAIRYRVVYAALVVIALGPISPHPARAETALRLAQQRRQVDQQAPGRPRRRSRGAPADAPPGPQPVTGRLVPALGGQVVFDPALNVTWLANANLAATQTFGVPGINPSGSMSFATAQAWVAAMNKSDHGAGYMGHNNWQLPTFPQLDATCGSKNKINFGYGCRGSALGSLYYQGLGLREPNTAVPMPPSKTGPFSNFQPYLYWTATPNIHHPQNQGYETFSFANGFHGANVEKHVMYVLPMIRGSLPNTPRPQGRGLQVNPGGQTIYDPVADVTWFANANLAASDPMGVPGINQDGSMSHQSALAFIQAMNSSSRYRQQKPWELPFVKVPDPSCNIKSDFGFGCTGSPLGELYYNQLKLRAGQPVVPTPDAAIGPFHHLQPYLYWGCGAESAQLPCGTKAPAPNFAWSFSFGNGFQGTDVDANELYVMVYHPGPVITPLPPGRGAARRGSTGPIPCTGTKCK